MSYEERGAKKRKLVKLEVDIEAANADYTPEFGVKPMPNTKETKPKQSRAVSKWTPDESEALFHAAIKGQASYNGFENAVHGKSTKQCYDKWTKTLGPWLAQKAREK